MQAKWKLIYSACVLAAFIATPPGSSGPHVIQLVKPSTTGGMPIMEALSKRQSSRSFAGRALPEQTLSDLIWAAYGINRPDSGKRTAPSALNKQEIDLYVVMEDGAYFYNAKEHRLELVAGKDLRKLTGKQGFVKNAAVNLVYVTDMKRSAGDDTEERLVYAGSAAGFIGQNVYLFCASEGLATVIRAYIDREQLGRALKLKPKQRIILSQSVGYPGE